MNDRKATQLRWDLWNLRAICPSASPTDLERLQTESRRLDRLQERLLRDPDAAQRRFAPAARAFFAAHPVMHRGLLLSLHLGPYSLAPVPWLLAGCDVRVLVNRQSHQEIAPIYEVMQRRLGLPGRIHWTPITGRSFAVSLARTLRRGGLVLAYLDGNDGYGGLTTTLTEGLRFALPGRDIRVRTGLARLAIRLGCAVHGVVTLWDDSDDLTWCRGPSWNWGAATDPDRATHEIFTWGFDQIRQRPEQWRCWSILPSVYDALGRADGPAPEAAAGSKATRSTTTATPPPDDARRISWCKPATLWPGDLLEDVSGHCFYDAAGLTADQLAALQAVPAPTVADLTATFGADFIALHVRRLLALGFLDLESSPDAVVGPSDVPSSSGGPSVEANVACNVDETPSVE